MTDLVLTDAAKAYLAARKAEARAIVTGGDRYTTTQRVWAWATLTGQQPHFRAPQQPSERPEPPRAA